MRLRQIWKDNKLVGLKLDKNYGDFINLDERHVSIYIEHTNLFIKYINSHIVPSPDKPSLA